MDRSERGRDVVFKTCQFYQIIGLPTSENNGKRRRDAPFKIMSILQKFIKYIIYLQSISDHHVHTWGEDVILECRGDIQMSLNWASSRWRNARHLHSKYTTVGNNWHWKKKWTLDRRQCTCDIPLSEYGLVELTRWRCNLSFYWKVSRWVEKRRLQTYWWPTWCSS